MGTARAQRDKPGAADADRNGDGVITAVCVRAAHAIDSVMPRDFGLVEARRMEAAIAAELAAREKPDQADQHQRGK
jgi:hypothetical protein